MGLRRLRFLAAFFLQIEVFLERARQDSNLRPSLFVVILLHRQGGTVGDRERQNSAFIRDLSLLSDTEGQGETPGYGQIAVKTCDSADGLKAGSRRRL